MRRCLIALFLFMLMLPMVAADQPAVVTAGHPGFPRPGAGLVIFALLMAGLLALLALRLARRLKNIPSVWLDILFAGGLTLAAAVASFSLLGSAETPQTYYQGAKAGDAFTLDLGAPLPIAEARYFLALGAGSYAIDFSVDGRSWTGKAIVEQEHTFSMVQWRALTPGVTARFVRVTTVKPGAMFGEIALFTSKGAAPLPVRAVDPDPAAASFPPDEPLPPDPRRVCDEPQRVPAEPSWLNGMYFDECYHARSAYEYTLGRDATETSHPPLGKLTISAGIHLFGFTPFGWRFSGALFGVLMVPLLYAFAGALFKKREWAFAAAFLFSCDFMRFTQTRIATIDVFGVFWILLMFYFMYRALRVDPFARRPRRFWRNLLCSGICLGIGAASKWIVLYAAVGLAVVFCGGYGAHVVRQVRNFKRRLTNPDADREEAAGEVDPLRAFARCGAFIAKRTALIFTFSALVFLVIPAGIYLASYIPFMAARAPAHPDKNPVTLVLEEQTFMYDYHAKLEATHDYGSPWYEWPVMAKPIWYYTGRGSLPPETASNIFAFGNPAVWWTGSLAAAGLLLAILAAGCMAIVLAARWLLSKAPLEKKDVARLRFQAAGARLRRLSAPGIFILIALAAQFLPWIVIPRKLTFIYHFFASVPFIILCLVHALQLLAGKWPRLRWALPALLGAALGLFVLFYPLLSGALIDTEAAKTLLRWFPGWFPYL